MASTGRFLREFLRPDPEAVVREETRYLRDDETLAATLYRPARAVAGGARPLPAWVVLHGLTRRGREHESLDPFARALAASGAAVLVPDIPEWRGLRVAPRAAGTTIRAVAADAADRSFIDPARIGVIGFSFGGTHALMAAADPAVADRVAAVVSWGGYASLRRTLHFAFTGDHELDGASHHLEPDPYGRWIFAGNYLTAVPQHADDAAAADALLWLARKVGERKIMAWEPATDPLKAEARRRLPPGQQPIFDLVAPPTDAAVTAADRQRLAALAERLVAPSVRTDPLLEPSDHLDRVGVPVFLAHGREDRLVPWTEMVRLRRALPADRVRHSVVTGLFAHSFGERWLPTPAMAADAVRLGRAIRRLVRLI